MAEFDQRLERHLGDELPLAEWPRAAAALGRARVCDQRPHHEDDEHAARANNGEPLEDAVHMLGPTSCVCFNPHPVLQPTATNQPTLAARLPKAKAASLPLRVYRAAPAQCPPASPRFQTAHESLLAPPPGAAGASARCMAAAGQ